MSPPTFGQHLVLMRIQGLVAPRRRAHRLGQTESWGSLAEGLTVHAQALLS